MEDKIEVLRKLTCDLDYLREELYMKTLIDLEFSIIDGDTMWFLEIT